jgi:hypothetical protein
MPKPEIWRLVPSVPGLLASSRGRIMVIPKMGVGQNANKQYGGYARKGCWDGARYIFQWQDKTYKVARLVCEAFKGPAPEGKNVCMHLDENSRNNIPDNLQWGTQKENLNAPGFLEYCRSRTGENSPTIKGRAVA